MIEMMDKDSPALGASDYSSRNNLAENDAADESALLDEGPVDFSAPSPSFTMEIALSDIQPSEDNPRTLFDLDKLYELAESIARHGVLQAILVRLTPEDQPDAKRYTIIAGERRYRAALQAGLTTIPAKLHTAASDREAQIFGLIENVHREDLNPMDLARSFHRLGELGVSQERIAKEIRSSQEVVSNTLRLLKLPEPVQDFIRARKLSQAHGLLLLKLLARMGQTASVKTDQEQPVIELAEIAAEESWTTKVLSQQIDIRFPKQIEPQLFEPETVAALNGSAPTFADPGPITEAAFPTSREDAPLRPDGIRTEGMTDEEWEASARPGAAPTEPDRPLPLSSIGDTSPMEPGKLGVATRSNGAPELGAPGDVGDQTAPGDEASAAQQSAGLTATQMTRLEDSPVPAAIGAPPPAPPAMASVPAQAKPEPSKPEPSKIEPVKAEPSRSPLAAGWTTAIVKEEDYNRAFDMGLWPPARAISAYEEVTARVRELEQGAVDSSPVETLATPDTTSPALALAVGAAQQLSDLNNTSSAAVLVRAEEDLLDELFPGRETTLPEHIVAVLMAQRLRKVKSEMVAA